MLGLKKKSSGGSFSFRVSDVVDVPLGGTVLRLRLLEGSPTMGGDLGVGSTLRLRSPAGAERIVTITGYAASSGKATQKRLERVREIDVVVSDADATADEPVEIGWTATGSA